MALPLVHRRGRQAVALPLCSFLFRYGPDRGGPPPFYFKASGLAGLETLPLGVKLSRDIRALALPFALNRNLGSGTVALPLRVRELRVRAPWPFHFVHIKIMGSGTMALPLRVYKKYGFGHYGPPPFVHVKYGFGHRGPPPT